MHECLEFCNPVLHLNGDSEGLIATAPNGITRSFACRGASALSISLWWQEWRAGAIQKRQERQAEIQRRIEADKRPARYAKPLVEGATTLGRFLAGANGVGLAASLTIIFSTYISLTSVDNEHICVASQFVSGIMQEGRLAAWDFFLGGLFAILAAGCSRFMWVKHNLVLHDSLSDLPAPSFESWSSSYSESQLFLRSAVGQYIPIFVAFMFFLWGLGHGLGLQVSSAGIQHNWQAYKAACTTEGVQVPPAAHSP
jgi:hypothetical protein